jgi:hypothetical protein
MLSATKTITTIQEGSIYKERWVCNSSDPWPADSTARMEFLDSAGGVIAEVVATSVDSHYINFRNTYEEVAAVPNGAGFRCYLTDPADLGEQMVRYGTVFRRQNFFPHSPAQLRTYEPKRFTDSFQRPPGALGGKWKNLLGRPKIFANTEWFGLGEDHPNTVGPEYNFFSRYFTRYYVPFNGDAIDLSISVADKGPGRTLVALSCNSDGSSYLYAQFNSASGNKVSLGFGHGVDINTPVLEPKTASVDISIPALDLANYKLRYDPATKEFAFYNDDYTTKYVSWVDVDDEVPHGKGYRYFAIAGNSDILNSGVQIGYISAADIV